LSFFFNFLIKIYYQSSYYDIPVNEVQRLINPIDNNKTEFTYTPIISEKLRELVKIPESEKKLADELKQQTKNMNELKKQLDNGLEQQEENMDNKFNQLNNEIKQTKDELKQQIKDELKETKDEFKQQMKIIQELLDNFIKNSNNNSE